MTQNFCFTQIFDPKSFFDPKFFWPEIFLTQQFFLPKLFWPNNFFTQFFKKQTNIIFTNFFDQIFFYYKNSLTTNLMGFDTIEINLVYRHKIDIFLSKDFWVKKFFFFEKNFGSKNFLGQQFFLVIKSFWVKKNFGSKKFRVNKIYHGMACHIHAFSRWHVIMSKLSQCLEVWSQVALLGPN